MVCIFWNFLQTFQFKLLMILLCMRRKFRSILPFVFYLISFINFYPFFFLILLYGHWVILVTHILDPYLSHVAKISSLIICHLQPINFKRIHKYLIGNASRKFWNIFFKNKFSCYMLTFNIYSYTVLHLHKP